MTLLGTDSFIRVIAADTTPSPGKGTATVAVNVPEKQFPIFALAGVSAAEQEGRRTGSDRCRERLTARTGVPRDAVPPLARRAGSRKCLDLRGSQGRRPAFSPEENPKPRSLHHRPLKAGGYTRRAPEKIVPRSRKGAAGSAPAQGQRPRAARPQLGPCLPVLPAAVDAASARSRPHRDPGRVALLGRPPSLRPRISDACQVSTDCQKSRSLHMDPQNQHGSGSSLVVIQQPALDNRQRLDYEREIQPAAILSLDQIKAIRGSNEYTEGPSVVKRPAPRTAPRQEKHERTHEIIPINVNNNYEHRPTSHLGHAGLSNNARGPILSRSTSTGSAASSGSNSSASSEQGLLGRSPPTRPIPGHRSERAIRTQPKQLIVDDLKGSLKEDLTQHKFICEQCGKCKCGECTAPRTLPSCLACNRQCLCSAESMVEYGTCMCLVKGIFYHCSNDDEGDSYSDNPCSCSQSQCCSSYVVISLVPEY
ncbi:hypothetical protein AB1E18_012760 [Capra hircus]